MPINISIADDHTIMIDGLKKIFQYIPNITLNGCYNTGTSLMAGLELFVPDVLLLDIQMPDKTGDELMPIILRNYPDLKILVLTNFDSALYANNMFKRGAHGYILKTAETETLIQAIEAVYNGDEFIEEQMKQKMEKMSAQTRKSVFSQTTLTLREKEVLQLIVDGLTNAEIAEKKALSPGTVKNYRTSVMLKLEVDNTATLVKKALKLGLAE